MNSDNHIFSKLQFLKLLNSELFIKLIYTISHFEGVVVAKKLKIGVFNRQLSLKYKSLEQILLFSDIFEQKSCILKKWIVTDSSSNQKCAYKTDGIIFQNVSPP